MSPLSSSGRRVKRGSARGAVFVEAIIVCSMLMVFVAGGLFLHRLYFAKLQVIDEARAAGWTQALGGCNGGANLDAVWSSVGANPNSLDLDTESVPSFFGSIQHTKGSAARTVTTLHKATNGNYSLKTTTTVACNEIPADKRGDVKSVIKFAASNLIPSFF